VGLFILTNESIRKLGRGRKVLVHRLLVRRSCSYVQAKEEKQFEEIIFSVAKWAENDDCTDRRGGKRPGVQPLGAGARNEQAQQKEGDLRFADLGKLVEVKIATAIEPARGAGMEDLQAGFREEGGSFSSRRKT